MGFLNDIINGKEKKYASDPLAGNINAAGKTGIDYLKQGASSLNDVYSQDPSKFIDNQIGIENKLLRTSTDDAQRRTRQLLAQRGMSGSSIGIGQQINDERNLSDKLALNNASGMGRLRDMQIQNGQGQMQAGQGLFGLKQAQGPIQMQDQYARTGGYGQLISAGIGAAGAAYGGKLAAG